MDATVAASGEDGGSEVAEDADAPRPWRTALRWGLVYGSFASAWIVLSDAWVAALAHDAAELTVLQRYKGLLFVGVTAAFVVGGVWLSSRGMERHLHRAQAATRRLRLQDQRWNHLMTHLDEVVWFSSLDGSVVHHVSDAAHAVYGVSPQAMVSQPDLWREVVHPEDLPAVDRSTHELLQRGARTVEYRIRHADGRWRWLRDRARVLRDASGRPDGIGGIVQDITSRYEAERRLRSRELHLAGIIDTAMDAIITIDAQHRIRVFNEAARAMFRIDGDAVIGESIDRFVPPSLQASHVEHVRRYAQTGHSARRMGQLHGLYGVRADGQAFPMEASISKLGEGDEMLMTVVIRDVSDRLAGESARQRQAEAEAASRAKTEFLSRMSHELRTPLNAVLGFSQLLQTHQTERLSPTQRTQVEHIRQAGWHLLALINDVLDVSRIEAGQLRVEPHRLRVGELVDEVLQLSGEQAVRCEVALRFESRPPHEAIVLADPIRLRQVLLNLVSNAIKYNRRGGHVVVSARVEGERLRLEVADDGLGMSDEQLRHLYEPFNRLGRERGGVEGTGIGLVLTRQLVQLMQADLSIESRPGEGTRAVLHLPLDATTGAEDRAKEVPAPPLPPGLQAPGDALPEGLVLYIEDNPVNMLVVEQLLSRWPGVRLVQAEDAARGLALARALRPDLVMLDMRLPDQDGVAVLGALRADASTAALQVVALSASAMPQEVERARAAGADEYWTKPLDFDRFLGDVRRLLGGRPPPVDG